MITTANRVAAVVAVLLTLVAAHAAAAPGPKTEIFDLPVTLTTTTTATATVAFSQELGPKSCNFYNVEIAAIDPATPDARAFYLVGMAARAGAGTALVAVQSSAVGTITGTAGASAWTAVVGNTGGNLTVTVTGVAGKTIHWIVRVRGTTVHFT
jgi:hypothetical protein